MDNSHLLFSLQIKNTLQCFVASVLRELKCLPWANQFKERDQKFSRKHTPEVQEEWLKTCAIWHANITLEPLSLGNKPSLETSLTSKHKRMFWRQSKSSLTALRWLKWSMSASILYFLGYGLPCAGFSLFPSAKGSVNWSGRQLW